MSVPASITGHVTVVPGDPSSSIVIHVPHSGTSIPDQAHKHILLRDSQLAFAQAHLVDWHTDRIAQRAADLCTVRPWIVVNHVSRFVVDPERLPDAQEPMARFGMGSVYTRTPHGDVLRTGDETEELLARYFKPYTELVEQLVTNRLAECGSATIVDIHSYPSLPLQYEDPVAARPPVCVGADSFRTPAELVSVAQQAFGSVAVNEPFAGCYVPLRYWGIDQRVSGLMVEIRRDQYQCEPGGDLLPSWLIISSALGDFLSAAAAMSGGGVRYL